MTAMTKMTPRDRVYAAFEGKKLDHYPVGAPYKYITYRDHWAELTGLHPWKFYEWAISDPDEHAKMYKVFDEKLPFDIFHPSDIMMSTEERENTEFLIKDDKPFYYNKKTGIYTSLPVELDQECHAPNEEQLVKDIADVKEKVKIEKAETLVERGHTDYLKKAVEVLGGDRFIFNSWVINTFYSCSWYVGFTNLFTLLYDEPELIHYLSERILEKNIERVRMLAAAGGDAIYIDDATSTNDMVSVQTYEKFSLPYITETVKEVKRLGMKAVVIYFGGISDRVEQIVSTGADAIIMETSMKNFVNDYSEIAQKVGGRACLFGNIDPVGVLEFGTEEELHNAVAKQVEAGRKYGRYMTSTGSPITPKTSVERIRRYIDIAHSL